MRLRRHVLTVRATLRRDWPGGQLTASAVSAIDFGQLNRLPVNQPRTLRELISSQPGNPGACWVSYTCYLPQDVVGAWIMPRIAALNSSLLFLPRTTIRAAQRSADGQRVTVVTAVQRVPREGVDEWVTPLSAALPDWYSPQASPHFHKTTLTITADVVVEATEFGDVLATAGLPFAQGVEAPTETSPPLDTCGQAVTLPFFLRLVPPGQPVPPPPPAPVPPTPPEAAQPPFSLQGYSWERVWTYRRALLGNTSRASGGGIFDAVTDGDVSQQNWGQGNDYAAGYIFLPAAQAQAAAAAGQWAGGLNLTALRQAEERAIGWARWYVAAQTDAGVRARLALDTRSSGTSTGLPKMPYLRDTRRGFGADGFVLNSSALAGDGQTGTRFADTVALANYPLDVHSVARSVCAMPAYIATGPGKPCAFALPSLLPLPPLPLRTLMPPRPQSTFPSAPWPRAAPPTCCWRARPSRSPSM